MQGALGETWTGISFALSNARRGLPGGSSLATLLAEQRGVRNIKALPDLTFKQILEWADAHHQKTGQWPNQKSSEVQGAPGEKWANIDDALSRGLRGLPGGSSLAKLLTEKRGVRNIQALPPLTIEQILKWADAHRQKTGEWPNQKSGEVQGAPGEKWGNIHDALNKGLRGRPGGSSLAKLLAEKRGVRNVKALPVLAIKQILKWADMHHQKTGEWPKENSGEVQDAPGEKWGNISASLALGQRNLPSGSSLAQLLAEKKGIRNIHALPHLTIGQILEWADAHRQKTGEWPNQKSGEVQGALGETWTGISFALSNARRGLPGGSSLATLLAEQRGVRNIKALPDLTIKQILKWADVHHQKTGRWPNRVSGAVVGAPGEKWANIRVALSQGRRSLPGGSSLAKLLAEKRPAK